MAEPAFRVIDQHDEGPVLVEVLEWSGFAGLTDLKALAGLAHLRQAQLPVRQVRVTLRQRGEVVLEAGALQFWYGGFETTNRFPVKGALRRVFGSFATGERLFRPLYKGAGVIWLEPGFGHFLIVGLQDESVIVDQGLFLCCSGGVEVASEMQSTVSAALFGGEGLFQTRLSGTGFVVLASPVPEAELIKMQLVRGRRVVVDGSFAVLRSGTVRFSVQKSSRTWLGTSATGEGLLQTFEGDGEVWVAPLQPVYQMLAQTLAPPPAGRA